jgi:carbamate kinase
MRIVAALGGNALQRRGEPMTTEVMERNATEAAAALAPLAREHELIVTHGNGPQVGLLALQAAADREHPAPPFDVLGAESEGLIGYVLAQELGNHLAGRRVAALLTRTVVDRADPAFATPTKPIGPVYPRAEGEALGRERGWTMVGDGDGVRRAIASPAPRRIVELPAVEALLAAGIVPVCAGGGGVPVAEAPDGTLAGVEAVVDKDATSALLADQLGADLLLLLTDVDAIYLGWGTPEQRALREVTPAQLPAGELPAGSMAPKARAAAAFVDRPGRRAVIGALADALAMVQGRSGTQVAGASRNLAVARGAA